MSASSPLRSDTVLGTGRVVGFTVTTPAFPATGVSVQNQNQYSVAILIIIAGTTTSWTLTDEFGNTQLVSAALAVGFLCVLPPGWSISFVYVSLPSWRWMGI